jgi:hypothetical protein
MSDEIDKVRLPVRHRINLHIFGWSFSSVAQETQFIYGINAFCTIK